MSALLRSQFMIRRNLNGPEAFGVPRFLAKPLENTAFFHKKMQNRAFAKLVGRFRPFWAKLHQTYCISWTTKTFSFVTEPSSEENQVFILSFIFCLCFPLFLASSLARSSSVRSNSGSKHVQVRSLQETCVPTTTHPISGAL